jgi:hypothetical protein
MRIGGLVVGAALALTACGRDECEGVLCAAGIPAALSATVASADGLPLTGVALQVVEPPGTTGFCSRSVADGTEWTCAVGFGPGRYVVDVVADGHAPQRLEATSRAIGGCCPTHESSTRTVALQRAVVSGAP